MNFDLIWRISAIISMSIFTPIFIYRYLKEKNYEWRRTRKIIWIII